MTPLDSMVYSPSRGEHSASSLPGWDRPPTRCRGERLGRHRGHPAPRPSHAHPRHHGLRWPGRDATRPRMGSAGIPKPFRLETRTARRASKRKSFVTMGNRHAWARSNVRTGPPPLARRV